MNMSILTSELCFSRWCLVDQSWYIFLHFYMVSPRCWSDNCHRQRHLFSPTDFSDSADIFEETASGVRPPGFMSALSACTTQKQWQKALSLYDTLQKGGIFFFFCFSKVVLNRTFTFPVTKQKMRKNFTLRSASQCSAAPHFAGCIGRSSELATSLATLAAWSGCFFV